MEQNSTFKEICLGIVSLNTTQVYCKSNTNIAISETTLIIYIKEPLPKVVVVFVFWPGVHVIRTTFTLARCTYDTSFDVAELYICSCFCYSTVCNGDAGMGSLTR